jgi:hypothetical protein
MIYSKCWMKILKSKNLIFNETVFQKLRWTNDVIQTDWENSSQVDLLYKWRIRC